MISESRRVLAFVYNCLLGPDIYLCMRDRSKNRRLGVFEILQRVVILVAYV
jgi:hypothetical protein